MAVNPADGTMKHDETIIYVSNTTFVVTIIYNQVLYIASDGLGFKGTNSSG